MVIENRSKLQDISTDRIADFDLGGRAGEFTSIARVLEMVEESVTEHVESIQGAVTSVQRQVNNKECAGMPARDSRTADTKPEWKGARLLVPCA